MSETTSTATHLPAHSNASQPQTPMSEQPPTPPGQHSPSKSAAAWWRALKSGGNSSADEPTGLFVRRPGLNRSAVSSQAVPGVARDILDPDGKTADGVPLKYADSPIFGAPLDVSLQYAGVRISLTDHEGENFVYGEVPAIIAKCAVFLKQNARETEGIFRIPGSVRRIRMLQDMFSTPPSFGKTLDWTGFTVHDAANLLKRYFACLPKPVIPREKYQAFRAPLQAEFSHLKHPEEPKIPKTPKTPQEPELLFDSEQPEDNADKEAEKRDIERAISLYEDLILSLPTSSGKLLLYLIDLLSVFASESDANRMTAYNLAAIFQPSVLTVPEHDMVPEESEISREVLQFLIENSGALLERVQNHAIKQHEEMKQQREQREQQQQQQQQQQQSSSNNSINESPYTSANDRSSHETINSSADESIKPVPQLFVSNTDSVHSSSQSFHTRRHSKSLSSAQLPNLSLQDDSQRDVFPDQQIPRDQFQSRDLFPPKEDAPKFPGFLRRQRSTRSHRSGSGSRATSEEASESGNDDTERKSRFRRSLMILLPNRNGSRSPSPVR